MTVMALICAAIIIEGVITYIKTFVVDGKMQWQLLAGLVIGIIVAIAYGLDIFLMFDMHASIPLLGCILTGILLSRGSNYMFDLIDLLAGIIEKLKPKPE